MNPIETKLKYLLLLTGILASTCNSTFEKSGNSDIVYDSVLAAKYGADEYGMKTYIMALLERGPNRPVEKSIIDSLQKAHLENISRLAEKGVLVLVGPFLDTGNVRGIYIFDVKSIEEAKALTETDPAIQYGSLKMNLRPWYGSAALMQVNKTHAKLQRKSITE